MPAGSKNKIPDQAPALITILYVGNMISESTAIVQNVFVNVVPTVKVRGAKIGWLSPKGNEVSHFAPESS